MVKGKILVVDDERIILTAFRLELEDAGYYVQTALSGFEAIEYIKNEQFDVVFTDLIMPVMNGTYLCREIKKISRETEVVLFSGNPYEVEEQTEEFICAGGRDELLRKPLGDDVLISITDNLMKEIEFKRDLGRVV